MLHQKIYNIEQSDFSIDTKLKRVEALKALEPVNMELMQKGYPDIFEYEVDEYYRKLGEIDNEYLKIFIKWFPSNINGRHIVGILEKCNFNYDNKIFINIFEHIDDETKWYLCDVLDRKKRWKGIEDWIQNIYLDSNRNEHIDLLTLAVSKMYSLNHSISLLKQGFDLRPPMTAFAFGTIGEFEELEFLKKKEEYYLMHNSPRGYPKSLILKEIKTAIKKISKRIN